MLAKTKVFIKEKNIVLCFYFQGTLGSDCSKLGIKVADSTSGSGNQGEILTDILLLVLNLQVVS